MPMPTPTHPVAGRSVTDDVPTFDWTPVPDAETYRLQLAASDAFETIYYDETIEDVPSLSLADVLPDATTTVCWRVRAETDAEAPWSLPAHFEVAEADAAADEGQFLVDAPPVPIHPIDGDTVDPQAVAFTWEPVPEASGYQLQVGPTEAFDDPVVDLPFDQVTSLTLFDRFSADASTLYWRVRALFPNDTEGPWSRTALFRMEVESEEADADSAEETAPAPSDRSSPKDSPVAAGPARQARTSSTMAMTFVLVLVVSFVATILAIMCMQGTISF